MIRRVISVASRSLLRTQDEQLLIVSGDDVLQRIPIEDLGLVEIDSGAVTVTTSLVQQLMDKGVVVVYCDATHHPAGILLPVAGHTMMTQRMRTQLEASLPLKKRLWQHTVREKIRNQATVLQGAGIADATVRAKITRVRSADATNQEGAAAQVYWKALFPGMRRDRFGDYPNNLLNYGYAVVRACIARALVASGLLPHLGIHHRNQYNAFCLADDVMEPYRPFVDWRVWSFVEGHGIVDELEPPIKKYLLEVLYDDVLIDGERSPLWNAMQRSAASLAQVYAGEASTIVYPRVCVSANTGSCG